MANQKPEMPGRKSNSELYMRSIWNFPLLIPTLLALTSACVPANDSPRPAAGSGSTTSPSRPATAAPLSMDNRVKWHPGHYVTLAPFANDGAGYFDRVLDEISQYPAMRGVQKRYLWSSLEK